MVLTLVLCTSTTDAGSLAPFLQALSTTIYSAPGQGYDRTADGSRTLAGRFADGGLNTLCSERLRNRFTYKLTDSHKETKPMANALTNNSILLSLIEGEDTIELPGTIHGTANDDTLSGTNEANYMYGYGGNDTLRGNGGDDFLDGGVGADLMIGGTGDDLYFVRDRGDRVVEWANSGDSDWVHAFVHNADVYRIENNHYQLPDNVENVRLAGEAFRAFGNDLDNEMVGNEGNNVLDGKAGADEMRGLQGNDYYVVDNVNDVVIEYANQGRDTVSTALDNYRLPDNVENGELRGTVGRTLFGNDLDNWMEGTSGDDVFDGGLGHDSVQGGLGHDILKIDTNNTGLHFFAIEKDTISHEENAKFYSIEELHISGGNGAMIADAANYTDGSVWLQGNGGDDRLSGTQNGDRLEGGIGNDNLVGRDGHDVLDGGGGNDTLLGGAGDDTLIGGTHDSDYFNDVDQLTGGAGSDRFVLGSTEGVFYEGNNPKFPASHGFGFVTDFSQTQDTIQLHGSAADYELSAVTLGSISGTGIYLTPEGTPEGELIGLVQGDTAGLDLAANYFEYVS